MSSSQDTDKKIEKLLRQVDGLIDSQDAIYRGCKWYDRQLGDYFIPGLRSELKKQLEKALDDT